jgi:hypothetical protein
MPASAGLAFVAASSAALLAGLLMSTATHPCGRVSVNGWSTDGPADAAAAAVDEADAGAGVALDPVVTWAAELGGEVVGDDDPQAPAASAAIINAAQWRERKAIPPQWAGNRESGTLRHDRMQAWDGWACPAPRKLSPAPAHHAAVDDREAAWDRLHDALARLPGWSASTPQRDPLTGTWTATVVDLKPRGRGATRESLTAGGATEAEAVRRLAEIIEARISEG